MKKFKDWKDILYDECKDEPLNDVFLNPKLRKSKRIKDDIKRNKAKDNKSRAQSGGTTY